MGLLLGPLLRNITLLPSLRLTGRLFPEDGSLSLTRTLSDGPTTTQKPEPPGQNLLVLTLRITIPQAGRLSPKDGSPSLTPNTNNGTTSAKRLENLSGSPPDTLPRNFLRSHSRARIRVAVALLRTPLRLLMSNLKEGIQFL
jgi:hypothetical protein